MRIADNAWQVDGAGVTASEAAAIYLMRIGIFRGHDEINPFIRSCMP